MLFEYVCVPCMQWRIEDMQSKVACLRSKASKLDISVNIHLTLSPPTPTHQPTQTSWSHLLTTVQGEGCCFIVLHDGDPDWKVDILPRLLSVLFIFPVDNCHDGPFVDGVVLLQHNKTSVTTWLLFGIWFTFLLIDWRCRWMNVLLLM